MATINKRGDTYKITVSCGYDMQGKQIRRHTTYIPVPGMTAKQIEKELDRQKFIFEEKCKTGQILDGTVKFADFADRWFEDYATKQLKAKTLARYKELLVRINQAIGHIRIDKLQPQHLLKFYDNLSEAGMRTDTSFQSYIDIPTLLKDRGLTRTRLAELSKVSTTTITVLCKNQNISKKCSEQIAVALNIPFNDIFKPVDTDKTLSSKTVLHHHRLISSILATAVQWQVIFSNPCDRVKPPKVERTEAKYLDDTQTIALLACLEDEPIQYIAIINLLIYTGMRRGELCGLRWSDIDFKNKVINIQRTNLYLPEKGIFEDTTKNYSSQRVIKVSDTAFRLLLEYKMWQNSQRVRMGDRWIKSEQVFTGLSGQAIHPDTITGWFHEFVLRNKLPSISIHSLRHTNASLLIASGMNFATVSKRLGHANTNTLTKVYAHAIKTVDEIASDALEDMLVPQKLKAN
ncbi:MAG: tyrosine-type recombinase/integrase [Oscillospiraceae bacterium]